MSASAVAMEDLLELVVEEGASDLHLTVGSPPVLRISGGLHSIDSPNLTPDDTDRLTKSIMDDHHMAILGEKGSTDFGFGYKDLARFRVNVFKQKGVVGSVLRQIPSTLLDMNDIGLPHQVKELLYKPRGLILITGPTGSGKTTTLASMVNYINEERDTHIITVEDPIEYYHTHKKSIISQRELNVDTPAFSDALRGALRQDPDVIMVGEMRDLATMEAAISAAETGHLVFATLHTTGAARTVDRIVDAFPSTQQEQIRTQLSSSIVAVISQTLIPRIDKPGRVAAFEIMIATDAIRALIRDNKTFRITSDIQTGAKHGMTTLDDSLMNLYAKGMISLEETLMRAMSPQSIEERLGSR